MEKPDLATVMNLIGLDDADCCYDKGFTDVVGVVSDDEQRFLLNEGGEGVHYFFFSAWRAHGRPISSQLMTVLRPVSPESDWASEYPAGSIHKLRLLLTNDKTRAIFFQTLEQSLEDVELQKIAKEQRNRVQIKAEPFGTLVLDRPTRSFQGEAVWNGVKTGILLDVKVGKKEPDISKQLNNAKKLFADSENWDQKICQFLVDEILGPSGVGEGDLKSITAEELLKRIQLEGIAMDAKGGFVFYYHDDNLFQGALIAVSGSLKQGPFSLETYPLNNG